MANWQTVAETGNFDFTCFMLDIQHTFAYWESTSDQSLASNTIASSFTCATFKSRVKFQNLSPSDGHIYSKISDINTIPRHWTGIRFPEWNSAHISRSAL